MTPEELRAEVIENLGNATANGLMDWSQTDEAIAADMIDCTDLADRGVTEEQLVPIIAECRTTVAR